MIKLILKMRPACLEPRASWNWGSHDYKRYQADLIEEVQDACRALWATKLMYFFPLLSGYKNIDNQCIDPIIKDCRVGQLTTRGLAWVWTAITLRHVGNNSWITKASIGISKKTWRLLMVWLMTQIAACKVMWVCKRSHVDANSHLKLKVILTSRISIRISLLKDVCDSTSTCCLQGHVSSQQESRGRNMTS